MPSPATVQQNRGSDKVTAPLLLVPFTRAAKEHEEPFYDSSFTPSATTQNIGPVEVPAYGYVRHLKVLVEATGGTGVAAVYQPDAPFTAIQEIALIDVNGANIVGPFSGYDLFLTNLFGGYKKGNNDPRQKPSYVAPTTAGNWAFALRIPVEVTNRDGLGSLANQNASSTYRVRLTLNNLAGVYSANPTTNPAIRIRLWLEAWTQPAPMDLMGHTQAQTPPAHGTTQYWSKTTLTVPAGSSTQRLVRVGSYIRNLIFVYRNAAGARAAVDANFADPSSINWDTRLLASLGRTNWKDQMAERFQIKGASEAAGGLPLSVFAQDFCHEFDGIAGEELRDGYLPTVQSTRLEIAGTWGTAGTLEVLTNDITPTGEIFV